MSLVINTNSVYTVGDVASDLLDFFTVFGSLNTCYPSILHVNFTSETLVPIARLTADSV